MSELRYSDHNYGKLKNVIDLHQSSCEVDRKALNEYIQFLRSIFGEEYDYETNGFQCDFWVTFKANNGKYTLAGDLWFDENFSFYYEGD